MKSPDTIAQFFFVIRKKIEGLYAEWSAKAIALEETAAQLEAKSEDSTLLERANKLRVTAIAAKSVIRREAEVHVDRLSNNEATVSHGNVSIWIDLRRAWPSVEEVWVRNGFEAAAKARLEEVRPELENIFKEV